MTNIICSVIEHGVQVYALYLLHVALQYLNLISLHVAL